MSEYKICYGCGTVNKIDNINCETCGVQLIDEYEISGTKENIPEMPIDMIKVSTDQRPIKYDKELF